mmetsp:Transcript_35776/g.115081  ORF Transcript_35776/g.115081 Transcript_35776/m.115081 type:complete len:356 (+) Transcript_35776:364-1431(+)
MDDRLHTLSSSRYSTPCTQMRMSNRMRGRWIGTLTPLPESSTRSALQSTPKSRWSVASASPGPTGEKRRRTVVVEYGASSYKLWSVVKTGARVLSVCCALKAAAPSSPPAAEAFPGAGPACSTSAAASATAAPSPSDASCPASPPDASGPTASAATSVAYCAPPPPPTWSSWGARASIVAPAATGVMEAEKRVGSAPRLVMVSAISAFSASTTEPKRSAGAATATTTFFGAHRMGRLITPVCVRSGSSAAMSASTFGVKMSLSEVVRPATIRPGGSWLSSKKEATSSANGCGRNMLKPLDTLVSVKGSTYVWPTTKSRNWSTAGLATKAGPSQVVPQTTCVETTLSRCRARAAAM